MAFLNIYPTHSRLNYSKEFNENGNYFILALSKLSHPNYGETPGVFCVDLFGNMIWGEKFLPQDFENVTFEKVIQIQTNEKDKIIYQYVIHGISNKGEHVLLGINGTNGEINWTKKIDWPYNNFDLFIEPNRNLNDNKTAFYVALSFLDEKNIKGDSFISKFDFNGNSILGKTIDFNDGLFDITAIHAHKTGLSVAGNIFDKERFSFIIDLEPEELNIKEELSSIIANPELVINDFKIHKKENYFISGYLSKEEVVCLGYLNIKEKGNFRLSFLPKTPKQITKIELTNYSQEEKLYFISYDENNTKSGVLHQFNKDFELIWSKSINHNYSNKLKNISFSNDTGLITTSCHTGDGKYSLLSTNGNFDSCVTEGFEYKFFNLEGELRPIDIKLKSNAIKVSDVNFETYSELSDAYQICPTNTQIPISNITSLQSPNFYLQSAGSKGEDSTKGIHTRWVFRGALGEKHLPKGNYASNNGINFNKENDFVKVYRTKYIKHRFILDLYSGPSSIDNNNRFWKYSSGEREFFVYFRDTEKYDELITMFDPMTDFVRFLQNYKNRIIEIENKTELFFAVEFRGIEDFDEESSVLKMESFSVSENSLNAAKVLSFRNNYSSDIKRIVCENGRSIRYLPNNCTPYKFSFEFYTDFISETNELNAWDFIGDYALTLDNNEALSMLEPYPNTVHGKWKRFNEDAYVNTNNYKDKWYGPVEAGDKNIKQVVQGYINLSDNESNPTAIENVPLDDIEGETLAVSHLDMLNIASYDFHVGRMLGLGLLDVNPLVFEDTYVYIAEYTTFGDLEDGLGTREVQHLSMGLPTALENQRLPLPLDLKEIKPGVFIGNEGEPTSMTGEDGYTQDGRMRYITLYTENLPDNLIYPPFYNTDAKIDASTFTYPVFGGLEYRNIPTGAEDLNQWQKPELSNDAEFLNVDHNGLVIPHYHETNFLHLPEINSPYYVHKQRINGEHIYQSYGINWFSRARNSDIELTINTEFNYNPLLPPTNINSVLIREESPLLLSSSDEQDRLGEISEEDKTLIRLTFDYHSFHEMVTHKIPLDSSITNQQLIDPINENDGSVLFPDNQEVFADHIDIYYRNQVPNNVSGKIKTVEVSQDIYTIIETEDYYLASQDPTINDPSASPIVIPGTENNYVGGTLLIGQQKYIIHEVITDVDGFARFTVYNKEISDGIITNTIPTIDTENPLQVPEIVGDGFFMAVENMQNATSWNSPNPLALQVKLDPNWNVHREVLGIPNGDGEIERQVEKSRGIWSNSQGALVEEFIESVQQPDGTVLDQHNGIYKITFNGLQLDHYNQDTESNNSLDSVEWHKGIIRLHTEQSLETTLPNKTRKILSVIKTENIGETSDLVVYAFDSTFSSEDSYSKVKIGNNLTANYYPGYKVYLYKNDTYNLNEENILPVVEDVKYSIFGFQSIKNNTPEDKKSKISTPSMMFAQKMIEAEQPKLPEGALYATRPDFFGRSTYSLTTEYKDGHKPHGLLFYRTNDQAILSAIYSESTIAEIRAELKSLGGNEESYFTNRWRNFLEFTELSQDGDFQEWPPVNVSEERYKFPNPDKLELFVRANSIITKINENTAFPPDEQKPLFNVDLEDDDCEVGELLVGDPRLLPFVKGAILNAFVPLTELPIIYQHIEGNTGDYQPINKKQNVKNRDGSILHPAHEDFEMAPMMKVLSTVSPHKTQFVDFNLDGTSNNVYFYGVKELSSQMKMGEFSPFLGPVKLVNTNPPEAPEVKRIMPVLENSILGISPSIQLEINAYPDVQKIKQITIYRAFSKLNAQSVRTMQLVKTVNMEDVIVTNGVWKITDEFEDLLEVPYGDGVYYRVTVSREVEYAKANYTPDEEDSTELVIDYSPSQASKIVATMLMEVNNPSSPIPTYISEPINDLGELHQFMLRWNKTCYKGKYHVYKMNKQGNWVKIHELTSNEDTIYLQLTNTDIQNHIINTIDSNAKPIYHHFKIVAENTSGMMSTEENILTAHREENWEDIGGIGDMIIGPTLYIR